MKYLGIKLKPKSSLHLGQRENWLEGSLPFIHSDTLFSALCHCYLLLYGSLDDFLKKFLSDHPNAVPPFLISSAFPYRGNDLFFPLPANQVFPADLDLELLKKLKKIKYVNFNLLRRLLDGEKLYNLIDEIETSIELKTVPPIQQKSQKEQRSQTALEEQLDQPDEIYKVEDVPRIALNPLTNHPGENYFHFGQVTYSSDCGLFLLVKLNDPAWENTLKALFRLLADEGIGGDRTCGKGLFYQPEFFVPEIQEIDNPDGLYALSVYFPRPSELSGLEKSFYELEERKGYVFSPANRSLRRRSIRVLKEGSVLLNNVKRVGSLADVTPETPLLPHRVYRYGYLFPLPCKLEAT